MILFLFDSDEESIGNITRFNLRRRRRRMIWVNWRADRSFINHQFEMKFPSLGDSGLTSWMGSSGNAFKHVPYSNTLSPLSAFSFPPSNHKINIWRQSYKADSNLEARSRMTILDTIWKRLKFTRMKDHGREWLGQTTSLSGVQLPLLRQLWPMACPAG